MGLRVARLAIVMSVACSFAPAHSSPTNGAFSADINTPQKRESVIRALAKGLSVNDGEAIVSGWRGVSGWRTATRRARSEARLAKNPFDFGIAIRRLYANYPSLHSHIDLRSDIDLRAYYGTPYLPFFLKVDRLEPGESPMRLFVSESIPDTRYESKNTPKFGDEVISINTLPAAEWIARSTTVCRRYQLWQCYGDFNDALKFELLGWDRRDPITLRLRRAHSVVTAIYRAPQRNVDRGQPDRTACATDHRAYNGFSPVYAGWNLCAFQNAARPDIELWRLKSFHYPKSGSIQSVKDEIDKFWDSHWKQNAPKTRHLIIDVSGNGGGSSPVEWYSLIFEQPYQEQYANLLRLPEYDDEDVLEYAIDDDAHLNWIKTFASKRPDLWNKTYSFLPNVPQFCAPDDSICSGKRFDAKPNGFEGNVDLIVDADCVSSCSGFTWNILRELKPRARAFGMPDSGDTNYMRMPLRVVGIDGHWISQITATDHTDKQNPIATAYVMVTRTTDSSGNIISGKSVPVNANFPRTWKDSDASWSGRVLQYIMNNSNGGGGGK